jgi:integrase
VHLSASSVPGCDEQPEAVARQRYVTDGEYLHVLELARKSGTPYLANIMELAYMCRLRLSEVLDLDRSRILKEGLLINRRKGSKDALVPWTNRLRTAICPPGPASTQWIFVSTSRGRMAETTVQTAWQRLMAKAVVLG